MIVVLQDGWTALMYAAEHDKSSEVTKALLEHKDIDVNATNMVSVCSGGTVQGAWGFFHDHHMRGMGVV